MKHFEFLVKVSPVESHKKEKGKQGMNQYLAELKRINTVARNYSLPLYTQVNREFCLPSKWFAEKDNAEYRKPLHSVDAAKTLFLMASDSNPAKVHQKYRGINDFTQSELERFYCFLDLAYPSKGDGSTKRHFEHMCTSLCSYFSYLYEDDKNLHDLSPEHRLCCEIDRGVPLDVHFTVKSVVFSFFSIESPATLTDEELSSLVSLHVLLCSRYIIH